MERTPLISNYNFLQIKKWVVNQAYVEVELVYEVDHSMSKSTKEIKEIDLGIGIN